MFHLLKQKSMSVGYGAGSQSEAMSYCNSGEESLESSPLRNLNNPDGDDRPEETPFYTDGMHDSRSLSGVVGGASGGEDSDVAPPGPSHGAGSRANQVGTGHGSSSRFMQDFAPLSKYSLKSFLCNIGTASCIIPRETQESR